METQNIRNIVLTGHGATGKTTLGEHLLYTAGKLTVAATVESGKTVSDFADVELDHNMSIYTSLLHLEWKQRHVNILDTPGTSDSLGEVIAAFRSTESAIMLLSAKDAVQIETIKLWRRLNNRNRPRMVFINKMDIEHANYDASIDALSENFKIPSVPITVPVGSAEDYKGVIDLLHKKWYPIGDTNDAQSIPEEYAPIVDTYLPRLIEYAADANEELMEQYLSNETLSEDDVKKGIFSLFHANKIVPIFSGSALKNSGLTPLLNFVADYSPAPNAQTDTVHTKDDVEHEFKIDSSNNNVYAFLFKTRVDRFAGKLSFVKVMSGTLHSDAELFNDREMKKERIGKIFRVQGKELKECPELVAGDIGLLAKLRYAHTSDTFYTPNAPQYHFRSLKLPQPVFSRAIEAENKHDEDKLGELLQRFTEEDNTFRSDYNSETQETVIAGMGDLHLKLILEQIEKQHNIHVNTRSPRVAYRETITKPTEANYRHKKQTGGHGQFGEVTIRVKPLERGEFYHFNNVIRGGSVSRGYIPGVEKGLKEAMEEGVIAHYPVVDVGIELIDGKEHSVDSSELSFKLAARGALKEAMQKAGPILLEPIMQLSVFVSEQYLGDTLSDMSSRRANIHDQKQLPGNITEIDALVPQHELLNYCIDLRAITSGTGTFEMEFHHYATATQKIVDMVVKDRNDRKEKLAT